MNSRERVVAALEHREPDKVPNDFSGTIVSGIHIEAYKALVDFLGLEVPEPRIWDPVQRLAEVDEGVRRRLQSDCVPLCIRPPDTWSLEIQDQGDCYVYVDEWGTTMRMTKRRGYYFEFWRFPIQRPEDARSYRWPDPADPGRYRGLREEGRDLYEGTEYAICGAPLFGGGILEQATRIMGFEKFLVLLGRKSPWADYILGTLTDIYLETIERFLEEVGEFIQVLVYWDDLATQDSLLVSPETYRTMIKPKHRKLFDLVHSKTRAKVFFHTDGAIWPLIPDLIEAGVDILQPIQVGAKGIGDTAELKRVFGKDLVFWGASCDSQHTLPFGKPGEVAEETRRHVLDLKPGGGYVFGPIHNIQPLVPPENIMAMYEAFFQCRAY
ncbi:MAG: uroporphyrinogen-III decarboxylase [Thermoprotei archaeon]|nr:MAG: uroporphyrinogen-III decarboxylase [Thermoprotei archaeon]